MDTKRAGELISENLTSIYGYAARRLYEREGVEDLAAEIVCEVLDSIDSLQDDSAFWGFFWRTAENTFHQYLRRETKRKKSEEPREDFSSIRMFTPSPEEDIVNRTERDLQIYLVRRELSLLSRTRREVSVRYYFRGMGCSEISKELGISVEMVKYHLFKARRQMKEGIKMTRKLGEKSYDPGTFRIDFWGDWNRYNDFFDRKLRGSIVLAAYYAPMTAEELSVELGVAMPYLEEEIDALEAAGVLKKSGNKYQTNLVIITQEYEREVERKTAQYYPEVSKEIYEDIKKHLPEIKKLNFKGRDYDDNRLMFALLNMVMMCGFERANYKSSYGEPLNLKLGGHGWIFGYDNDYINHHFNGITGKVPNDEGTAWFSAENYKAIVSCQNYEHIMFNEKASAMISAILEEPADESNKTVQYLIDGGFITCRDGILHAEFPVFDQRTYNYILNELLDETCNKAADFMIKISDVCTVILKEHAPASVSEQCSSICKIHHRLDVAAIILETLINDGSLTLPAKRVPLCVFGVTNY